MQGVLQETGLSTGGLQGSDTALASPTTPIEQLIPQGRLRDTEKATARKDGLTIQDLILIAVLLAAGAVLKLTLGSVLTFAGMKPNFIIAMYCLAILLVRPKPLQALTIGILAGLLCQIPLMNATPWLNIPAEALGAFAMSLLVLLPFKKGKFNAVPMVAAFFSTVVSGYTFVLLLALLNGIAIPVALVSYAVMVFGTAVFNAALVSLLLIPMRKVLKR